VDEQRALWRTWESTQDTLAPTPGANRALSIDVERAREAVARLEAVGDEVLKLVRGMAMLHVSPPGADEVSRNAARQSTAMVAASRRYLEAWHSDVLAGVRALRQQLDDYERIDTGNATRA
jgi:hypothetical protein